MTMGTKIENPLRLPKQMKHWFAQIGVYTGTPGRDWRRRNWFFGVGRTKRLIAGCRDTKRCFRVMPHLDRMDICDGYMDRWANSMGASISPIPRTEAEFKAAINILLEKSADRVRENHPTPNSGAKP